MIASTHQADQVRSIHYMRGVAALMVVGVHIFGFGVVPMAEEAQPAWLRHGVAIFFVISGFVMVESTRHGTHAPGNFLKRRFIRVMPFWWIMLTAWVLIGAPFDAGWLMASYALLPSLDPSTGTVRLPVLGLGWTLYFEMAFYALFAAALLLPRTLTIWGVVAILCVAPWFKPLATDWPLVAFYLDAHFFEFAAGMVIAHCRLQLPGWTMAAGFAALAVLDGTAVPHWLSITIPAAVIIAAGRGLDDRLQHWTFPKLLGDASYAIYLSHMIVIHLVVSHITTLGMPWLSALCAMLGAIGFGVLVHKRVERPLLQVLSHRRARQAGGSRWLPGGAA
ncbi:acyltransferase family protein [Aurantiacibacter gangjinensis]|uniref:Uncharacterized protein n=1 Tax=Aurantiacibacter gangjinensis TaxID=502682 RepID=A0A0G9MPW8_9SPHN|nr:acyltransferase [Aurantiacibacter gangjinensis]APE27230.1 Exopolysaccharide production protein ExoZ [Aurantiacibacter gangjinensis]KLE31353.1 hypothetical protein AAW01_07015 [Aurantiacibacter gangjinensis]